VDKRNESHKQFPFTDQKKQIQHSSFKGDEVGSTINKGLKVEPATFRKAYGKLQVFLFSEN
jgi:hypothetical protein